MKTTMTIEKAAELVNRATGNDKYELFAHFEELLNPNPPKIGNQWNDKAADWQEMFAKLCGFQVAKNAKTVK